jgi:hypothetical protein
MQAHVTLYGTIEDDILVEVMEPEYTALAGQIRVEFSALNLYLPPAQARALAMAILRALPAHELPGMPATDAAAAAYPAPQDAAAAAYPAPQDASAAEI